MYVDKSETEAYDVVENLSLIRQGLMKKQQISTNRMQQGVCGWNSILTYIVTSFRK